MSTATTTATTTTSLQPPSHSHSDLLPSMLPQSTSHLSDNGTSLIARAEALNAFMKMQPAANQARHNNPSPPTLNPASRSTSPPAIHSNQPSSPQPSSCFCFGTSRQPPRRPADRDLARPKREYYPDNLSVQPQRHPWSESMQWLILACVDFLEQHGLGERNIFAVSAVDDLVRDMSVQLGQPLPTSTDPHVAAGVIKAQIRHADSPLVSKDCLRAYIEHHNEDISSASLNRSFVDTHLSKTILAMEDSVGAKRAYVLARIMRLLGRVSANEEVSKMNAHCLAKCVAPSMLHWDPNSSFALLMLGKITAFVMAMIEDARVFDEQLCHKIQQLSEVI